MSNFILIHGAWGGSWCWYKLTPKLLKAGHKVNEIDLNHLNKKKYRITDYVDYVSNMIEYVNAPIILGHSMAGAILSVLTNKNIKAIIYLNAFIPDNESIIDIIKKYPSTYLKLDFHDNYSLCTVNKDFVEKLLFNKSSKIDIDYAKKMMRAQNYHIFNQKIIRRNKSVEEYYIMSVYDNILSYAAQYEMVKKNNIKKSYTLEADHSPFFSDVDNLAKILCEITSD